MPLFGKGVVHFPQFGWGVGGGSRLFKGKRVLSFYYYYRSLDIFIAFGNLRQVDQGMWEQVLLFLMKETVGDGLTRRVEKSLLLCVHS